MSEWYYAQENQQQGPVNEAELKEFLAVGKLPPTILVWKEGMANWAMANSLPEFQFRPPPVPSVKPMAPMGPPPAAAPFTPFVAATTASPTATAAAPVAKPSATTDPAPDPTAEVEIDPDDVNKNKAMAILAYLGLLFIIPMLVAKESPFAKYHTNQGMILFIAGFILMIASSIVSAVVASIPFIGMVAILFWPLCSAVWLVFSVIGILNAAKGERKPLPYIGHYTIYS